MGKNSQAALLRDVLDDVTDIIYVTDSNHQIVEANKAFLETFGLGGRGDVLGKKCHKLVHGQATPCEDCLLGQLNGQKSITIGCVIQDHRGEKHDVEVSLFQREAGRITHIVRDVTECKRTEAEQQKMRAKIKVLEGLLPICAGCKKIRDDRGCWETVESYISQRAEVSFTHGLCPDCIPKYFSQKE